MVGILALLIAMVPAANAQTAQGPNLGPLPTPLFGALTPLTSSWFAGTVLYTDGSTTTVPASGVAGLDVEVSSMGLAQYAGSSWVAIPVSAEIAEGSSCSSDNYMLQASIGYDTTNGLEFGYGVFDFATGAFVSGTSQNSNGNQPLDSYWLQAFYKSSSSQWEMVVTDAKTSTVVWSLSWTDPLGGTTVRTSGCSSGPQDWAAIESQDFSTSNFPSTFGAGFFYAQYASTSLIWTTLSHTYTLYAGSPPSNIYIQQKGGGLPYEVGVFGAGQQATGYYDAI